MRHQRCQGDENVASVRPGERCTDTVMMVTLLSLGLWLLAGVAATVVRGDPPAWLDFADAGRRPGSGFRRLELTTRLSEEFGDDIDVVLIDKADGFLFGFSKLDVMFGWFNPRQ